MEKMKEAWTKQMCSLFSHEEQFLDYQAAPLHDRIRTMSEICIRSAEKGHRKRHRIALVALQGLTVSGLHQAGSEISLSFLQHNLFLDNAIQELEEENSDRDVVDETVFGPKRGFFYEVRPDPDSSKGLLRVTVRIGGEIKEIDPVGVSYQPSLFTYAIWQVDMRKIQELGFQDDKHFEKVVLPFMNAQARETKSQDGLINGQGEAHLKLPSNDRVFGDFEEDGKTKVFSYSIDRYYNGEVYLMIDHSIASALQTEYKGEDRFVITDTDPRIGTRLGFANSLAFSSTIGCLLRKIEDMIEQRQEIFPFANGGRIYGRFSVTQQDVMLRKAETSLEDDLDLIEMVFEKESLDASDTEEDKDVIHYEVMEHQLKDRYRLCLRKHMTNDFVHVADLTRDEEGFALLEVFESGSGAGLAVDALNRDLKKKELPDAVKVWRGTFRIPKSDST